MRKETAADHVPHRGERASLTIQGQDHVYLAQARVDAHALAAAVEAGDAVKVKELTDSGRVIPLDNPTPVQITGESFNERQIQVVAGPAEGKTGWVPYEWLKPRLH
jgi:hypothetical protein